MLATTPVLHCTVCLCNCMQIICYISYYYGLMCVGLWSLRCTANTTQNTIFLMCPKMFAPSLIPGQRDTGTRKFFCSGTKGQRDNGTARPTLSRDVLRDVPSRGNPNLYINYQLIMCHITSTNEIKRSYIITYTGWGILNDF